MAMMRAPRGRRRPVATDDRSYLHFEAFEIAADEVVLLSLRPLAASRRAPRSAVAAFLTLAAVTSLLVLAAPLRGRRAASEASSSALALEREAVYAGIRDLDHDFETGKLAEEDYEAFRSELRARAVALLREERLETATPSEPGPPRCPECQTAVDADARFCSQCGAALSAAAPGGERVRSA